jgi:hypothetical protein
VIGTRLGPYEITARLGAGGMGEVLRARDTSLGREVAIKVLPAAFTQDAERVGRFRREAQILAALNHPNIATIHGLEEADGIVALAMELVPGEDLSERIRRGALPVEEALEIARQIAEALEEAHEKGIVHRDLKPANVKVGPEGRVKVLDFGLAKAFSGDTASGQSSELSQSPTLAHTGTAAGVILGTAAYMSPEQARGKAVDKRADVWAFGVVLFEMLTGRRLFEGETVSDVLASVLKTEPDWSALPAATPAPIRQLLRRCLERNPKNRLHDVADARIVIDEVLAGRVEAATTVVAVAPRGRSPWWPLAVAAGLALGVAGGLLLARRMAKPEAELRFPLALPAGWKLADADSTLLALSRDGRRRVVAAGAEDGRSALLVGEPDQPTWRELPGTEAARAPFFSPDGSWIGYFGDGTLQRVSVDGGPPVIVARGLDVQVRGGTWLPDGSIVFAPDADTSLLRVREGGEPEPLTRLGPRERTHRWPDALPDGSAVVFTVDSVDTTEFYDDAVIEAVVVATGERKVLVRGSSLARYLDPGVLLFARGGSLFATRMDPRSLAVEGTPVPVLQGVSTTVASGAVHVAVAGSHLFWVPGDASDASGGRPVWIDRTGARSAPLLAEGTNTQISLAPDGKRLAVVENEAGRTDIWIVDLETKSRSRLTFDGDAADPAWSPDGRRVLYTRLGAAVGGESDAFWKAADGSGDAEGLVTGPGAVYGPSLSPDGQYLVYDLQAPNSQSNDLWIMPMQGERKPRPLLAQPPMEMSAHVSPDGRFLAYLSMETNRFEVFVRQFPSGPGVWQVSRQGGTEPHWAPDGRRLYFRTRGVLHQVAVDAKGGTFAAGPPERVLAGMRTGENQRSFAPAPDGERFVVLPGWGVSGEATQVNLALNWKAEVRRRLGLAP